MTPRTLLLLSLTLLTGHTWAATQGGLVRATVRSNDLTISYALPVDCTSATPATADCEMEAKTDTTDTEEPKRKLYYTIGGVRLKLKFNPESLTEQEKTANPQYHWTFKRAGRICPSFEQKKDNSNCTTLAAETELSDKTKTTLWWEPADWTSPANTDVTLTVKFSAGTAADDSTIAIPDKKIRMRLQSRTLKAVADTEEPLKGSDVIMLEQMLWQLGMSPGTEKGTAGIRLAAAKSSKFKTDNPSVGRMIGRFNYSNFGYVSSGSVIGVKEITTEMHTGTVSDNSVIKKLSQHWLHYLMAYQNNSSNTQYLYSELPDTTVNNAVAVFDGGTFGYSDSYAVSTATFTINPTYTAEKHKDLTQYKSDFKRSDILKAMASREASGIHWGQGSNAHRISVGTGDELGSKGFNQIQNAYSYGARSGQGNLREGAYCGAVTAYTTGGLSYANHYDPAENLKAKAMFLTYYQGDCNRGFYLAFYKNNYTAPLDKRGLTLKAMTTGTKTETITGAHTDDTYEVLAKGLGAYNQGHSVFNKTDSWAELLIEKLHSSKGKTEEAMRYALDILHTASRGIELPYRQYIWQGGTYPPVLLNDAGELQLDTNGNPISHPQAGQTWCFGYGESEWLAGTKYDDLKIETTRYAEGHPKTTDHDARVNCE